MQWLNNVGRMRAAIAGGILAIAVVVAALWWYQDRQPDMIAMQGSVVIENPDHYWITDDGACHGHAPLTDVRGGATVFLTPLPGEMQEVTLEPGVVDDRRCVLRFTAEVEVVGLYQVQTYRMDLGRVRYQGIVRAEADGGGDPILLPEFRADWWLD